MTNTAMGLLMAAILLMASACAGTVQAGVDEWTQDQSLALEDTWSGDGWSGKVDWQGGYLQATGRGVGDPAKLGSMAKAEVMALKAGRYLAYQKLLEVVMGVRLDERRSLGQLVTVHRDLMGTVHGMVKGARLVAESTYTLADGSVVGEVTVRLPLGETAMAGRDYLNAHQTKSPAQRHQVATGTANPQGQEVITGLIVDASGLGARPALFPSVVEEGTDRELFGPGVISRDYAIDKGVVGYAPSVKKALLQERLGSNPMVVKALRAEGLNKAKLVLGRDDAAKVMAADVRGNFLKTCGVVIVIH